MKDKFSFKSKGASKSKRAFISSWTNRNSQSDESKMSHTDMSRSSHKVMSPTVGALHKVKSPTIIKPQNVHNGAKEFFKYYSWVRGDKIRSMKIIPRHYRRTK